MTIPAWTVPPLLVLCPMALLAVLRSGQRFSRPLFQIHRRLVGRLRMWLAAALVDTGYALMVCDEERGARSLQRKLSGWRVRRHGLQGAFRKLGATEKDEVTLEIPIGSRVQQDNPTRTLLFSAIVRHPARDEEEPGRAPMDLDESARLAASLAWRVVNRPSEGYSGAWVTVDVPSLEQALISYHARPLRASRQSGQFLDNGVHAGVPADGLPHEPSTSVA